MIIHNIIPQFCGNDFSKKVIFRSTFYNEDQEREDGFGKQEIVRGEGFIVFDRFRDVDFVKHKDDIQKEIKSIFGTRGESMLGQCVLQTQKYYEHVLRPQIDEIVAITNRQSEEKLRINVDGDSISLNSKDIVFLSEIKSDRIIFLNQSEKQIFQIYTCKLSKPKSLL